MAKYIFFLETHHDNQRVTIKKYIFFLLQSRGIRVKITLVFKVGTVFCHRVFAQA